MIVQPGENPTRPGYFDFGEVDLGSFLNHTFILRNSDPRTVVLQKVDPGCGCTVARIGKRLEDGSLEAALSNRPGELMILAPGEVVEIALRVDTTAVAKKNLDKLFMVRLATDSVTRPFLTLECHLLVRQHFQVSPASLDFGDMPVGAGAKGVFTIRSLGLEHHRLVQLKEVPQGVEANLIESSASSQASPIWELTASFLPPIEKRRQAATLVISTLAPDGEPGPDLELTMAGTGVDDVSIRPQRLILRPNPRDTSGTVSVSAELVSRLPGHAFRVTGYSIQGDQSDSLSLSAEAFESVSNGSSPRWNLTLETRTLPTATSFSGMIIIELDDPQYPRIELPYVGLGF